MKSRFWFRWSLICIIFLSFTMLRSSLAQTSQSATGSLHGQVADPSGAVIPGADIAVTTAVGKTVATTQAGGTGTYQIHGLPPGTYSIMVTADGFATYTASNVKVNAGQTRQLNAALTLEVQQQQVHVSAENSAISTSPDSNGNALVLKGKALDALSDDPDELESELQALAGPSAGPNGGQLYIDGFTGGQMPPKSSIREIRINQNPFSAEFDRLGYGRIEIFTKPGTQKIHGHIFARGNSSAFNAQNPILNDNLSPGTPAVKEPGYYSYMLHANIGGPINGHSSYFAGVYHRDRENVNVVSAINPASITPSNPNGTHLHESVSNPSTRLDISPRLDFQFGQSNTLTTRYSFYRETNTNQGIGETSLPTQGYNSSDEENTLQASDSLILSKNFVDDIRFRYRRIRSSQSPQFTSPSVAVQGAFVDGGSNSGTVGDNQDTYEVQDYFTGAEGKHSLTFGGRLRAYRDANYTDAGTNGSYTFQSVADYLNRTPQQYQVTVVNNNQYTARAIVYDLGLFYQDDWKISPRFTFSYGTRWETQNQISDHNDWAPRIYLAYALGPKHSKPKTVVRAGYGWFYQRFIGPDNWGGGTPYVIQTIHNNLPANPSTPSNQQIFIVNNPPYTATDPANAPKLPLNGAVSPAATYYTTAPKFDAALDMQGAIGVDRQITKAISGNITYLYSRGIHQYLTNNIDAPFFDSSTNTYPATFLKPPARNIYQYQSGGVYREHQIIVTVNGRFRTLSLHSFYSYSNAKGDTDSVGHFPSNAHDPAFDYGRTSFDIPSRFLILANYQAPYAFAFSPFLVYNSGTPYNVTIGSDLTANNQFNARPTYAVSCTEPGVVQTKYGCLNSTPTGTREKIIPYGLGTGPSNVSLNLRVSKVIGFGPRIKGLQGGGGFHHGGGVGSRGLTGSSGGMRMNAGVPRKYSLTLSAYASNLFNTQNLGTPNSTLTSPLFGKAQSLAGGFFGPSTAGNRSIFLQSSLNF